LPEELGPLTRIATGAGRGALAEPVFISVTGLLIRPRGAWP
jgi:hypothetical protein